MCGQSKVGQMVITWSVDQKSFKFLWKVPYIKTKAYRHHRGIIVLFESWGLQATKLRNLWNLSHFTYTSLPTEGKRCNTSTVAGAYSGLAIAESFESYRL